MSKPLPIVLIGCLFLIAPAAHAAHVTAESLPKFARDAPYEGVRTGMLARGWAPSLAPGRFCNAATRPDMCRLSWPEVDHCAATGFGPCRTLWEKDGRLIEIHTTGIAPGLYERTTCRVNCR